MQKDRYAPTSLDIEGQDQAQWFAAGRLATFSDFGPWTVADFAKISKPNWTLVPVPGKGFPMEVGGLAIAKNATGKKAETAKKFVEFASTQPDAQDQLIQGNTALGVPIIAESHGDAGEGAAGRPQPGRVHHRAEDRPGQRRRCRGRRRSPVTPKGHHQLHAARQRQGRRGDGPARAERQVHRRAEAVR